MTTQQIASLHAQAHSQATNRCTICEVPWPCPVYAAGVIGPYEGPRPYPERYSCAPEECGGTSYDPCFTAIHSRDDHHDGEDFRVIEDVHLESVSIVTNPLPGLTIEKAGENFRQLGASFRQPEEGDNR